MSHMWSSWPASVTSVFHGHFFSFDSSTMCAKMGKRWALMILYNISFSRAFLLLRLEYNVRENGQEVNIDVLVYYQFFVGISSPSTWIQRARKWTRGEHWRSCVISVFRGHFFSFDSNTTCAKMDKRWALKILCNISFSWAFLLLQLEYNVRENGQEVSIDDLV
jgi:hypothetical protein